MLVMMNVVDMYEPNGQKQPVFFEAKSICYGTSDDTVVVSTKTEYYCRPMTPQEWQAEALNMRAGFIRDPRGLVDLIGWGPFVQYPDPDDADFEEDELAFEEAVGKLREKKQST